MERCDGYREMFGKVRQLTGDGQSSERCERY